jgi:RimJ/RimL family protein N-acetyltransferase
MIRGTKTRLCALEHDDLPQFVRWIRDPQTRRFMIIRHPHSMTEEQKGWESCLDRGNEHIFAIEAEDGTHVGNIGLRHEGTLRQAHYADGQYHDEHIMAILRKEFLEGRGETG